MSGCVVVPRAPLGRRARPVNSEQGDRRKGDLGEPGDTAWMGRGNEFDMGQCRHVKEEERTWGARCDEPKTQKDPQTEKDRM